LTIIGKNSEIPAGMLVEPGATIGTDVIAADYLTDQVKADQIIQTNRKPYEI
jgi:acetyltransferase-like isoleucine patch superfamily enzyme